MQFRQLVNIREERTPTRQDDTTNKFLLAGEARTADFPHHVVQNLLGTGHDDFAQVTFADFLRLPTTKSGNDDESVFQHFGGYGAAVVYLQFFGLLFHYGAALLNVRSDYVTTEGNYCRVADDAIFINRNIGSTTADIDEGYTSFFLITVQDGSG